jgi:hypothetical protein
MPIQGIPISLDWLQFFKDRRDELTNPDDIAKVDMWITHIAAEHAQDIELTMETMTPDGASRVWGGGPLFDKLGAVMTNVDRKPFYQALVKERGKDMFKFVAMDSERFFVGEDGLVVDGVLWNIVPGEHVARWGAEIPEGSDPNGNFALGIRMAQFVSFKDGRIVGEDSYLDSHCEVRPIDGPLDDGPMPSWLKLDGVNSRYDG